MDDKLLEEKWIKQQIEWHRQNLHQLISSNHSLTHPAVVRESQAIDQLLNRLNRLKHRLPMDQSPSCRNRPKKRNIN